MITLIADDLTGASDAAAPFARRGLATHVVFELVEPPATAQVQVLAVDSDTRGLPPTAAHRRVREVADRLSGLRPELVYKKVDSTLRGNLGAEVEPVMDAFDFRLAVVAPAFPRMGRTTRHGVHHLHGRAVHQTEIGRDPHAPVRESNIVQLLQSTSRRKPALVSLETVQRGSPAIRAAVEDLERSGASLIVFDAEDERALRSVVDALAHRRDVLWVGSAGLAEHVAERLAPPPLAQPAPFLEASHGPILVVAGSASEVTRRQLAALAARPGVAMITIHPTSLAGARDSSAALNAGLDCALAIDQCTNHVTDPARLADQLAAIAAEIAQQQRPGGLILTGGATAHAVCRHLAVNGMRLLAEVEPGVPMGALVGGPLSGTPVVTKAGAFGSERTLLHALDQLKGEQVR